MELLESLITTVRGVCAGLPDKRRGRNCQFTMADIGMGAFSVFFMQSPSFLAHQRQLLEGQGRSNCHTLFQMIDIPCDNHIRAMLDPVEPSLFHPAFEKAVRTLEANGGLAALRCLGGHVLIALDGTQYHRSSKVRCKCCSTVSKGKNTEYFHSYGPGLHCCTRHPATIAPCRCSRPSSRRRTEARSRTAKAVPAGAG